MPNGLDYIFLIHKATLEVYGIEMDFTKTKSLAGLLHQKGLSIQPHMSDLVDQVHGATLELYGIKMDSAKTREFAELLRAVAEGERTFIDSDSEKNAVQLRKAGEAEGIDMQQLTQESRRGERNAARRLLGLPPIED